MEVRGDAPPVIFLGETQAENESDKAFPVRVTIEARQCKTNKTVFTETTVILLFTLVNYR